MTDRRLRVGIIGAGAIVQVAHLPVLKRTKLVDLVAICDSDLPKARVVADRFQIRDAFDDIEEVLQYEELDALLICTPNHLHESHILAALSRGLHVLVEKPLATSLESVERIKAAVEKHQRVLMVGMNHRYRPDVQIVRGFVQSGELGPVESVRGSWHVFKPSRSQLGWRLRRELSGGGAMLDLGLAILDLGLWLAGNPAPLRVSASFGMGAETGGPVEQAGSAYVVCESGASIFLDVTWNHIGGGERFGVGLRGGKGSASINPLTVWKKMHGAPMDVAPTGAGSRESAFASSYRAEWAHFFAAIAGEAEAPSLDDYLGLHQAMDAIYRSAETGKEVKL
jgi:predicted dehydrogenase